MADVHILDTLRRDVPGNRLYLEDVRAALTMMLRIRIFETRAKERCVKGVIKGTAHCSIGQEAIAAGACAAQEPNVILLTHHSDYGHTIAKGCDIRLMFAELMGRALGYCERLCGSMHIPDFERNILGANGIAGSGMGLGTGAALAEQLNGSGNIGISSFGDGAANEGLFHEALTYRWDDHSMRANLPSCSTDSEEGAWKTHDPVTRLRDTLVAQEVLTQAAFETRRLCGSRDLRGHRL